MPFLSPLNCTAETEVDLWVQKVMLQCPQGTDPLGQPQAETLVGTGEVAEHLLLSERAPGSVPLLPLLFFLGTAWQLQEGSSPPQI